MRVRVDPDLCQAYANCLTAAPDVFTLDEATGLAVVVLEEPPAELERAVHDAVRLCPVRAITTEPEPSA
jgi:ferredoxin